MGKGRKSPNELTFLEHLEDLRKRLFLAIISIIIAAIPSWFFSKEIYKILSRPVTKYLPEGTKLAYTHLTAPFILYIKVAFLTAIFIAAPYIFLQLWYFVAPGLYKKEKKYLFPFIFFTSIFFIGGALFGYFVAFPFACNFFIQMGQEFTPVLTVDQFFSLAIKLLLGIAIVFELPTLVFFLSRMGIVTHKWMIKNFKYAILIVFIIAAIITPSPDVINQSIIAGPMLALYGLSIFISFLFGKKKNKSIKKKNNKKQSPAG